MGFFNKLFGSLRGKKSMTLGDEAYDLASKLTVSGFRRIAKERNCAPTEKTSDQKIMEIVAKVGYAFNEAALSRGERIPARNMNVIVFSFLQVYEMTAGTEIGEVLFDEHLKFEIEKYQQEGLRKDYSENEINLV